MLECAVLSCFVVFNCQVENFLLVMRLLAAVPAPKKLNDRLLPLVGCKAEEMEMVGAPRMGWVVGTDSRGGGRRRRDPK